jgi:NNP family nitrate/nitrite transporter-like MFS transporter
MLRNALTSDPLAATAPEPARWRMLHLTWVSFFLTFVVWFNLAPFASTIGKALGLTADQVKTLLICNVALTIPARILVGQLVDRFGPRRVFTALLVAVAVPCTMCALATSYWQMVVGRLLVSCVGAGFVVGIRLVGEWFDAREIGTAEGIYGGLGNFGMAAATFALPLVAVVIGGEHGWRWAMAVSGVLCVAWAGYFYRHIQDAPPGREFRKPKKRGALEVCTRADLIALVLLQIPLFACLGVLAWKLVGVKLLPEWAGWACYVGLALLLAQQIRKTVIVNRSVLADPKGEEVPANERYSFSQVAILCLCYAVTFGGELAVESMLPHYFEKMFGVSVATAGVMGAGFAFASLIARPLGGWMGDRLGRKPIMIVSLAGSAFGYFALYMIGPQWSVGTATAIVVIVGFFLMAGNGANFCIAPLIRKPLTGQIAGLIGAYGNVGSVLFLTLLSLTGPAVFFLAMAGTGLFAFVCCFLIKEPGRVPAAARDEASLSVDDESALPAAVPAGA